MWVDVMLQGSRSSTHDAQRTRMQDETSGYYSYASERVFTDEQSSAAGLFSTIGLTGGALAACLVK